MGCWPRVGGGDAGSADLRRLAVRVCGASLQYPVARVEVETADSENREAGDRISHANEVGVREAPDAIRSINRCGPASWSRRRPAACPSYQRTASNIRLGLRVKFDAGAHSIRMSDMYTASGRSYSITLVRTSRT